MTGDVTVEAGATLTIQPEVVVKFAHERAVFFDDFPTSQPWIFLELA